MTTQNRLLGRLYSVFNKQPSPKVGLTASLAGGIPSPYWMTLQISRNYPYWVGPNGSVTLTVLYTVQNVTYSAYAGVAYWSNGQLVTKTIQESVDAIYTGLANQGCPHLDKLILETSYPDKSGLCLETTEGTVTSAGEVLSAYFEGNETRREMQSFGETLDYENIVLDDYLNQLYLNTSKWDFIDFWGGIFGIARSWFYRNDYTSDSNYLYGIKAVGLKPHCNNYSLAILVTAELKYIHGIENRNLRFIDDPDHHHRFLATYDSTGLSESDQSELDQGIYRVVQKYKAAGTQLYLDIVPEIVVRSETLTVTESLGVTLGVSEQFEEGPLVFGEETGLVYGGDILYGDNLPIAEQVKITVNDDGEETVIVK